MKRLTCACLFVILATLSACDALTGNECGPFDNRFRTLDFSTALAEATIDTLSGEPMLSPISNDTLQSDLLAIDMQPDVETYREGSRPFAALQLIPAAHACSPPLLKSNEVITSLRVVADADFTDGYPAGSNLAPLFDVAVYNRAEFGYQRFELPAFLRDNPSSANRLILLLKARPDATRKFQFTVEYEQEGSGLETYTYTSEPVVVTADTP